MAGPKPQGLSFPQIIFVLSNYFNRPNSLCSRIGLVFVLSSLPVISLVWLFRYSLMAVERLLRNSISIYREPLRTGFKS